MRRDLPVAKSFYLLIINTILITDITINNYKSIKKVDLPLSRVNVFIGENGAGKSNILEALALVGAASANKLDNEFLTSRGMRVTRPEYMRPAFSGSDSTHPIVISVSNTKDESRTFKLTNSNEPYSKWEANVSTNENVALDFNGLLGSIKDFRTFADRKGVDNNAAKKVVDEFIQSLLNNLSPDPDLVKAKGKKRSIPTHLTSTVSIEVKENEELKEAFFSSMKKQTQLCKELESFIIYSPENSALRTFQREGQVEPLGVNGEGLLKLISVLSDDSASSTLEEIKSSLRLLGWFEDFKLIDDVIPSSRRMEVKDRYIDSEMRYFDQMSTNEGFLFLLFYFTAISSSLTPKFFAVDNIDASLNPKLCEKLIKSLVKLAKMHDKQLILTTHNPATLDGLNLDDDEQRLFVVSRGRSGDTKIKRVSKPTSTDNAPPVRLSEMFIKGILGGLPKGF